MHKFFYDAAFSVYALFAAPLFVAKGKHKEGFAERMGEVPADLTRRLAEKPVFWIHSVSAGETRLSCHLASRIRSRLPGYQILLTTTTASGREIARQKLAPEDIVLNYPLDWSFTVKRFLDAARPRAAVFFETEMWPNMLLELKARQIPAIIVNGRISDGAFKRYRAAARFLRPAVETISKCLAQSEEHRRRFVRLGMPEPRVKASGNLKYDLEPPKASRPDLEQVFSRLKAEPGAAIVFAASTHPGEEEMVLEAYLKLKGLHPNLRLVLAPRHVERLAAVEALISRSHLSSARLSKALESRQGSMSEILIVDVWGVLNDLYPYADIVFVGGSLVPTGGHNIAEPALAARAIVHGPHMFNFTDMAAEFAQAEASVTAADARALEAELHRLLKNPGRREEAGRKAKEVVMRNQGATERCIAEILESLRSAELRAPFRAEPALKGKP